MGRNGYPLPPKGEGSKLRSFKDLSVEDRALAGAAYDLWRDLAVQRANPYGDHTGCLLAGRMAINATRWADGFVILDAIRGRMDEKSSPRWIPEWSREFDAEKQRARHVVNMAAEREMWDDVAPEARRVMVSVARAKSRGEQVSLEDVSCIECRQFTETKCPKCQRALHSRSCPSRHTCASVSSGVVSSPHSGPREGSLGMPAADPDETSPVSASAPLSNQPEATPTSPPSTSNPAAVPAVSAARAHRNSGAA